MVKPDKVLHICLSPYWGGMEQYSLSLANKMNDYVHTELLVQKESPVAENASKTEIQTYYLSFVNYVDFISMYQLRKLFYEQDYDVVHFHGSSELGLISPALFGLNNVVLVNHKHIHINSDKKDWYHRLIYRRVDAAIVPTSSVRQNVVEKYPLPPSSIHVIPNAIDISSMEPDKSRSPLTRTAHSRNSNYVTTVGRLVPNKGIETFLDVAELILKERMDIEFFIAGTGEDQYVEKLRQSVSSNQRHKIHFLGHRTDVPDLLHETDLFCSFSTDESFGLSLLEAMYFNLPVLAFDIAGPNNLLSDHPESLLNPEISKEKIKESILQKLEEESYVKYDLDQYKFDTVVPTLLNLYENRV